MPHQAFLKLAGIQGSSVFKAEDKSGFIPLLGFEQEISSEFDPQRGPIPEERRHRGLTVVKNVDFSTPKLHEALAKGDEFATARINFFHMPRSGDEKNYFTINMTKVRITAIRTVMPSMFDPALADTHEYEEVDFVYESYANEHTAPTANTLEAGSYSAKDFKDVQAVFAPDWVDEEAKAVTMQMLAVATAEVKAKMKADLEAEKSKK